MSTYGPAFFIKRKDKKHIEETKQKELLKHITDIAQKLQIKNDEGKSVHPQLYDYDGYEEKSVSFLIHSSILFIMMPEEVQEETEKEDEKEILKIGAALDKLFPSLYEYRCYYVEA